MKRDEILSDLVGAREAVVKYYGSLPLGELYRYEGAGWAPVDDLRHLTLSVLKVTQAFRMPAESLIGRFGPRRGPSRTRAELGAVALRGLEAGGRAPEDLSPPPVPPPERTEEYRAARLAEWEAAAGAFEAALAARPEEELDALQAPHPFLGMLSLREWAHFNVLHPLHHLRGSERRLGRGRPTAGSGDGIGGPRAG